MRNRVEPQQWKMLDRLAGAGCPVNYSQLLRPVYPLRVVEKLPGMGTNIVPLSSGGTGIALRLEIMAASDIRIRELALRKRNWATLPIQWTEFCEEHEGYCFHIGANRRAYATAEDTLNFWFFRARYRMLKRGAGLSGYLLGTTPETLKATASARLNAILVFEDDVGDRYPFPVSIATGPVAASSIFRYRLETGKQ